MTTYRHVRALERGLKVLATLNKLGTSSVADITRETGIHRTTVHRLLATLQAEGFVRPVTSDERFCLTRDVVGLSQGYSDGSQLSDVAVPIMKRLVSTVTWPSDICVTDGDMMRVQESTHHLSPISFHRCMINSRWPILSTAAGRAYLAFCGEKEQNALIERLKGSKQPGNELARDAHYVQSIIDMTRSNGYAYSFKEANDYTTAIALPIYANGQIVASINVICFASAINPSEAAERFLPELATAVSEIERGFEPHPNSRLARSDDVNIQAHPAYN